MVDRRVGLLVWLCSLALAACHGVHPAAAPVPCAAVSVERFVLASAVLGEDRPIFVYAPPAPREPGAALPVLFVLDGGIDEDLPHVVDAVAAGIAWGLLRPVLVVGIANTDRRRDLTGPTEVATDRAIAPQVGASAPFRRFLREELLPTIAARYATDGRRAVIGESLAGLFVVETLLLEPDLFDDYIAFSPSLWWNARYLARNAAPLAAAARRRSVRVLLATANEEDIVEPTASLAATLRDGAVAGGLVCEYRPMPEEFHDTIYRAAAPRALRQVFLVPGK